MKIVDVLREAQQYMDQHKLAHTTGRPYSPGKGKGKEAVCSLGAVAAMDKGIDWLRVTAYSGNKAVVAHRPEFAEQRYYIRLTQPRPVMEGYELVYLLNDRHFNGKAMTPGEVADWIEEHCEEVK